MDWSKVFDGIPNERELAPLTPDDLRAQIAIVEAWLQERDAMLFMGNADA